MLVLFIFLPMSLWIQWTTSRSLVTSEKVKIFSNSRDMLPLLKNWTCWRTFVERCLGKFLWSWPQQRFQHYLLKEQQKNRTCLRKKNGVRMLRTTRRYAQGRLGHHDQNFGRCKLSSYTQGKISYNTWLYDELGHRIERAPYVKSPIKQKSCPCWMDSIYIY